MSTMCAEFRAGQALDGGQLMRADANGRVVSPVNGINVVDQAASNVAHEKAALTQPRTLGQGSLSVGESKGCI